MKVREVTLKNFKRFEDASFSFVDEVTGEPHDLMIVVGSNGTGKSTLLQAIAATVGTATGRLESPEHLGAWPGFEFSLVGRIWSSEPQVTVDVDFSAAELDAIGDAWRKLGDPRQDIPPGRAPNVRLVMNGAVDVEGGDRARKFQFSGRRYAARLRKADAGHGYGVFDGVGSVYWYTEQRTANSFMNESADAPTETEHSLDVLRQTLANLEAWELKRGDRPLRPGERAMYRQLDEVYGRVFPGRSLDGQEPREPGKAPYFFFSGPSGRYEIAEMSAGERAVFPMLFDFAFWNINHSIVLIDEVELHLHPPLQQALLRALPKLGTGNQFILTTHSDSVARMVRSSATLRL